MLKTFDEFSSEKKVKIKASKLDKHGQTIWDKVVEILPNLISGYWTTDTSPSWVNFNFNILKNSIAGSWKIENTQFVNFTLSEIDLQYIPEYGFCFYERGGAIENTHNPYTDPVKIAMVINKKLTEKWIVDTKHELRGTVIGNKYDI